MMTYYTIDDLRLPPKRPFHRGWTMERFPTLAEALAWYRVLPASGIKSLGMTSGVHVLELVRCLPLFPGDSEGENVLASCPQELPLWAGEPESIQASETCISALSLRYQLDGTMITPIPPPHGLPKELRDKYLWLSERDGQKTAIRWVYIAGTGRIFCAGGAAQNIPWCSGTGRTGSRNRGPISPWRWRPGNTIC